MGFAQAVAVNSEFTKGVVARTWPRLKEKVDTKVVYPCVDTTVKEDNSSGSDEALLGGSYKVILSINRFERKKDIGLAVKAFAAIPEAERRGVRLVLAGIYYPHSLSLLLYMSMMLTKLQAATIPELPKTSNTTPSSKPSPPPTLSNTTPSHPSIPRLFPPFPAMLPSSSSSPYQTLSKPHSLM